MKRLVWGAVLFLCAAASSGMPLNACDKRALEYTPSTSFQRAYEMDGNTVLVISDDEFVTIVVYSNAEAHTEWM